MVTEAEFDATFAEYKKLFPENDDRAEDVSHYFAASPGLHDGEEVGGFFPVMSQPAALGTKASKTRTPRAVTDKSAELTEAEARYVDAIPREDRARRAKAYLAKVDPAVQGEGGDRATFAAACILSDFNVDPGDDLDVMKDWNECCQPPWSPEELREKIGNARQYGTGKRGGKLLEDAPLDLTPPEVHQHVADPGGPDEPPPAGGAAGFLPAVIRKGNVFWILHKDNLYGTAKVNAEEAAGSARQFRKTDESTATIKAKARVVEEVHYEIGTDIPQWNDAVGILTIPRPPMRKLEPLFDPRIDKWLRHVGGAEAETLLRWVASVPCTTLPTPALVLIGPKEVGKTLLPHDLAKLWTLAGPVEMASLGGDFNDDILRCPLIYPDEALPKWHNKNPADEIRRWVATGGFTIHGKGLPRIPISGYLRVVVAANNPNVFRFGRVDLTSDDRDALAQRLLYLKVGEEAAEYLRSLNGWWPDDAIAQHALALRKELAWDKRPTLDGRFMVRGNGMAASERMLVADRHTSAAMEWIVRTVTARPPGLRMRVEAGCLWMNASTLTAGDLKFQGSPSLSLEDASTTLGKLETSAGVRKSFRFSDKVVSFRPIPLERLEAFIDEHDLDRDGFRRGLCALLAAVNPAFPKDIQAVDAQGFPLSGWPLSGDQTRAVWDEYFAQQAAA